MVFWFVLRPTSPITVISHSSLYIPGFGCSQQRLKNSTPGAQYMALYVRERFLLHEAEQVGVFLPRMLCKKKEKSSMAGASLWRILYHRMWGQLSTTCSNLLKQPNRELVVAVDHNQPRTMASDTVDPIESVNVLRVVFISLISTESTSTCLDVLYIILFD